MTEHNARKRAMVTGALSGTSATLALVRMAAQGTHAVLAVRSADRLTALAARVEGAVGRATVLPVDLAAPVTNARGCSARSRGAAYRWTAFSALTNNAGLGF